MSYNYLRYGILTTYKHTYFLRRMGNSTLSISGPISLDGTHNITILKCWLFILLKSHEDGLYSSPSGNPFDKMFFSSSGSEMKQPLQKVILNTLGVYKMGKYNLTDIKSSQIQFADIAERNQVGVTSRGCCGAVISGSMYGNENIKFKTMDSFNRATALEDCEKEIRFYAKLETLQGNFIPKFYGFFNLHGMLILALEDCGTPLPISCINMYEEKVKTAISKINGMKVQHGDLEIRELNGVLVYPNILMKMGQIRIIDFHVSSETKFITTEKLDILPQSKKSRMELQYS